MITPNGRLLHLEAGDYRATVTTVGATLASLTWRGRDLVHPLEVGALPRAYEGKVLAPWPNRIRDGRWTREGVALQVPITEVATGNALHGLVSWLEWDAGTLAPGLVSLHATLAAQPGYPFGLGLEVRYALAADGLDWTISAVNDGAEPAPVGLGFHPYLTVGGGPIDELTLSFAPDLVLPVDERGLPADRRSAAGTEYDFTEPRRLAGVTIDAPYRMAGPWAARLLADDGTGVELSSTSRWSHLYTGELLERRALAVEPTTCPPDAFNSGEDLDVLAPGQAVALTCRIAAVG